MANKRNRRLLIILLIAAVITALLPLLLIYPNDRGVSALPWLNGDWRNSNGTR